MQTYLQAVSSLPLRHNVQLPLNVPGVFLQSTVQKVTLAPGQEESTGQAQEVIQRGGADPGGLESELLVPRGAELVAHEAKQLLDLWHRQHRFDVVGERTGVHLGQRRGENEGKMEKKSGFILLKNVSRSRNPTVCFTYKKNFTKLNLEYLDESRCN